MKLVFLQLFALTQVIWQVYAQGNYGPCLTPLQEEGSCILLNDCSELYSIVQRGSISSSDRTFLKASQCGYINGQVLICCKNKNNNNNVNNRIRNNNGNSIAQNVNLLPETSSCGLVFEDRIFGGRNTSLSEFPWMVLLEYSNSSFKQHKCAGSLINNRYVLTAAHCVKNLPYDWRLHKIRLGEWRTTTNPDCINQINGKSVCNAPYIDVDFSEVIPHPEYPGSALNKYHDIALIRLRSPVTFSQSISPVCLPVNQRDETYLGRPMIVSGWGRTETRASSDVKLKADVNVVSSGQCNNKYSPHQRTIASTQLCAGGVQGIDSCHGDSGGPLVVLEQIGGNQNYYLAGVVSYGQKECGLADWPGVYTRIGAYIDWILEAIRA